jgi:hypothetical protein
MTHHKIRKYRLEKFWDDTYKTLCYVNEPFNDILQTTQWVSQGYANQFTGDMCDMRSPQPEWNQKFLDLFAAYGWKNVGTSYYRMPTGTVLPPHSDLYLRYIDLFQLQGREHTIRRAIVFLEDWQPGHYAEYMNNAYVNWQAGDTIEWSYDTLHMAANLGPTPRYTLQITGHI